ncbi:hypothetical protein CAPI_02150 [Corynebacterium capitovis DSM 44611]|uniref:GIY-YIG nuclease family protein n=1 Tax=Corynebacterium capitovis TaxID=131081 RepID=UPI00036152C8|nr:GIY-YIG nuclease family protein [Corynebacterium capitovis]WKD57004.1 hypothetical protein CAPI_02150 [Corynebacterium capitovis DSM 44611]
MTDDHILAQLDALIAEDADGLLKIPEKPAPVTATDRLTRAFAEIEEFVEVNGREPDPDTLNISERKLGARLVGIRASEEKMAALRGVDKHGLLEAQKAPASVDDLIDSDLLGAMPDIFDVSRLPARKSPEGDHDRATRVKAEDFAAFKQLFSDKHAGLNSGEWRLTTFAGERTIKEGRFFIVAGVMAFVADVHEPAEGESKPRLRVVFENGTESSMYRESLATRLYETNGQAVTRATMDVSEIGDADVETGHIYVLRSLSDHPDIRGLADLHKIGFSSGPVAKRIAGAEKSPTYLMAPVKVVADYRVYNLRPSALEHLLHRVFAAVRLDASVAVAAGGSVAATEWFLAPLSVIDHAVDLIMSGEIVNYLYDPAVGELVVRGG